MMLLEKKRDRNKSIICIRLVLITLHGSARASAGTVPVPSSLLDPRLSGIGRHSRM